MWKDNHEPVMKAWRKVIKPDDKQRTQGQVLVESLKPGKGNSHAGNVQGQRHGYDHPAPYVIQ